MAKLIRLACSIIALTAFVIPVFADEPQITSAEKPLPLADSDHLSASFDVIEIDQRALAQAGLSFGFPSNPRGEMDAKAYEHFVEFVKLAENMQLAKRVIHQQLLLSSGQQSILDTSLANGESFKLQVLPILKGDVASVDLTMELASPVTLASMGLPARKSTTFASTAEYKLGTSYLYQNQYLGERQSGKNHLFLVTFTQATAPARLPPPAPLYSLQVKLYERVDSDKARTIKDATQIKLFQHFDANKDRVLVDSTLMLAEDEALESNSGGSQGIAPMQIDFGTRIKLLATKPQDGLIPVKLELDLCNAIADNTDTSTLAARGRTVSVSTRLSPKQKKVITIDNHTHLELTIEPCTSPF